MIEIERAKLEGALREIVRLTVIMSDGTTPEEYSKALSILYKEKIMIQAELSRTADHREESGDY